MTAYEIRALDPSQAALAAGMTFPAYRHMLTQEQTQRHPGEAEQRVVTPICAAAWEGDALVGLALAEAPITRAGGLCELLSLYVRPESRSRGVATALLAWIEEELARRGFESVMTVYMTGKPSLPAVERILEKRGWLKPQRRAIVARFAPEEIAALRWFGRMRLSPDYEIFSWTDMTPEALEALRASNQRSPWVTPGLEAWRYCVPAFDAVSSVGLRYRGEVVGWVINHRSAPEIVRFVAAFARQDLPRRGAALAIIAESIRRLVGTGCRVCTFATAAIYQPMIEFVMNRNVAHLTFGGGETPFIGETRETMKRLVRCPNASQP